MNWIKLLSELTMNKMQFGGEYEFCGIGHFLANKLLKLDLVSCFRWSSWSEAAAPILTHIGSAQGEATKTQQKLEEFSRAANKYFHKKASWRSVLGLRMIFNICMIKCHRS